jgi:hypothetical protein
VADQGAGSVDVRQEQAHARLDALIDQKVRAGYDYRWWGDLRHHADEILRAVLDD